MEEDIYIKIFKYASNKPEGVTHEEIIKHLNIPEGDKKRNFVGSIINNYFDRAEGYKEKFLMNGKAHNHLNQFLGLRATNRAFQIAILTLVVSMFVCGITYYGISTDIEGDEIWQNNQILKIEEIITEIKNANHNLSGKFVGLEENSDEIEQKLDDLLK